MDGQSGRGEVERRWLRMSGKESWVVTHFGTFLGFGEFWDVEGEERDPERGVWSLAARELVGRWVIRRAGDMSRRRDLGIFA